MSLNGQTKTISKAQVQQAIRKKRLYEEELRAAEAQLRMSKLDRARRVSGMFQESVNLPDLWISSYWDQLRRNQSDFDFTSANMDRGTYAPGSNPPIFINEDQLRNLRNTARLLADWNGYARGLLGGLVSYVCGKSGFSIRVTAKKKVSKQDAPQELIERCQQIVDEELERNDWRGDEQPGLEQEIVRREHVDGEDLIVCYPTDDGHTDVRVIEPELLTQPTGANTQGHSVTDWSFGVLNERHDVAKHLAYWVQWGPGEGEEFRPDQVTHIRRNVVRNVKRGLTSLYGDVVEALHGASALRRNMVEGAAIQASYSGVMQHEHATESEVSDFAANVSQFMATDPLTSKTEYWQKHKPGMVHIPKGQNFVQPPTATNAAAHVDILQAGLRAGGMWANAPEWLISGLHDTSSFASSLTAESPWTLFVLGEQGIVKKPFANIAWTMLKNRINKGERGALAIQIPVTDPATGQKTGAMSERSYPWSEVERLLEIQVEGQNPETRNKAEDASTNTQLAQSKLKSPQTIMQEMGLDVEQELSNMEEWEERLGQAGLALPMEKRLYDPGVTAEVQSDTAGVELPVEEPKEGEQPPGTQGQGGVKFSQLKVDAEGWVTTDKGHKLFIDDESGEITKGNPHVLDAVSKKQEASSKETFRKEQESSERSAEQEKTKQAESEDKKKEAEAKKREAEIGNLAKSILQQAASKKDEEEQQPGQLSPPKGRSRGKQRDSILLEVPDRRQDTDYSCGPAALEAVASYYGIEVPEATLRALSHTDKQVGTETDDLADAARQLGLKAQVMSGMELEDLHHHLSQGHPVIVGVQAYQVPEDADPETGELDSGHYDVAIGFDKARNAITIQDPARAPDAGRQTVNADSFVKAWRLMADSGRWVPGIGIVISKPDAQVVRESVEVEAPAPKPPLPVLTDYQFMRDYLRGGI